MKIESILVPERTFCSLQASSKKRAIELAAAKIAATLPEIETGKIYRSLIEREKLGTTALGHGVAIPHCRLDECSSIVGGLFTFDHPVDFSAHDDLGVNIIFVLLVPATETTLHLKTLATLAERLEQRAFRESLLGTKSDQSLFEAALAADTPGSSAG